jgi:hypothetical protein
VRSTRRLFLLLCVVGLCLVLTGVSGASAGPLTAHRGGSGDGSTLVPGEPVTLRQRVPVNVVLVGYDARRVGFGIRSQLADSGAPVVRFPRIYGLEGRELGLGFSYDYRLVDAPRDFEDRFFSYLTAAGTDGPPTEYQERYNAQTKNVLDVTGPVLTVDGPDTERYLERAARWQLGLDATRAYTVFLVNWWGRDDFRFHVYRTTDTVDPDTGVNFGLRDDRANIAWGGDSGRSWFYDLSAGPHARTANWNVDTPPSDVNHRMPPVWEYTKGGYRAPEALGADLGRVVRYVAVNLLFTPSPLFDPLATAPEPGGAKDVRVALLEGDPGQDGASLVDPDAMLAEWRKLQPHYPWKVGVDEHDPTPADAAEALAIWSGASDADGCWQQYGSPLAQLFCWADANRDQYFPASDVDHVLPVFAYSTTDESMAGLTALGFAEDNWVDGTPSFVFAFAYPSSVATGYGFTSTITHEVGHHLGLSHPTDGYDPTTGVDYGPVGAFRYTGAGDESATVMSYMATSNSFDVFDSDNAGRWELAGYLRWSADLLGDLQGADLSDAEATQLAEADRLAGLAVQSFRRWDYVRGAGQARAAWELVQTVATAHGVEHAPVPPAARKRSATGGADAVRPDPKPMVPAAR